MKHTRRNIYSRLSKTFLIRKKLMSLSGLLILLINVVSLLKPYLYKLLVDDVMTKRNVKMLYIIIPSMILIYIIKVILLAISTYINNKFCNLTKLAIKNRLMKKFLFRDMNHIVDDVGKQCNNLEEDSGAVYTFLSTHVVVFIASLFMTLIYLILMMSINYWLGFISIILIPGIICFSRKMGRIFNEVKNQLFELTSKTRTYLFDSMQQWQEIKSYTLEKQYCLKYDERLEEERKLNCKWMLYYALNSMVYIIKEKFVMKILIYFIGGLFIIKQDLSIGALLMFMSYMESMETSLNELLKSNSDFTSQRSVFDRLFMILEQKEPIRKYIELDKPNVVMRNVDFTYADSQKDIFRRLNCNFIYGKKYLIVGKSGEGKSTLVKLILGVSEAKRGEVFVNNIPINEIKTRILFKHIGVAMRENVFFNLSIRENFQIVVPNVTEADMKMALAFVFLDDFVDSLPQKLDTVIGERGIKLSGGQRQRLALARLILHNPEILILDEATSALDSVIEDQIMENFNRKYSEKTIIVISHKPLRKYHYDYLIRVEKKTVQCEENLGIC